LQRSGRATEQTEQAPLWSRNANGRRAQPSAHTTSHDDKHGRHDSTGKTEEGTRHKDEVMLLCWRNCKAEKTASALAGSIQDESRTRRGEDNHVNGDSSGLE